MRAATFLLVLVVISAVVVEETKGQADEQGNSGNGENGQGNPGDGENNGNGNSSIENSGNGNSSNENSGKGNSSNENSGKGNSSNENSGKGNSSEEDNGNGDSSNEGCCEVDIVQLLNSLCPENEVFSACAKQRYCDDLCQHHSGESHGSHDKSEEASIPHQQCNFGCQCKARQARNAQGRCIPVQECIQLIVDESPEKEKSQTSPHPTKNVTTPIPTKKVTTSGGPGPFTTEKATTPENPATTGKVTSTPGGRRSTVKGGVYA